MSVLWLAMLRVFMTCISCVLSEPDSYDPGMLRMKTAVVKVFYPGRGLDYRDQRLYLQNVSKAGIKFERTISGRYKCLEIERDQMFICKTNGSSCRKTRANAMRKANKCLDT